MAPDQRDNQSELTDEQAGKIAGGRTVPPPESDGSLDPSLIRKLEGQSLDTDVTATHDAQAQ